MRPATRFFLTTTALVTLGLGVYWLVTRDPSTVTQPLTGPTPPRSTSAPRSSTTEAAPNSSASPAQPPVPAETLARREAMLAVVRENIKDPLLRRDHEAHVQLLTNGIGTTPAIKNKESPQFKSMAEALTSGKNPERVTDLLPPPPFSPQAYRSDPKSYLNIIEPGRVHQSAEPADGVPAIDPITPYWQEVPQGGSIELSVRAAPGWPVTFTSFDCGAFENELTSITVQADGSGLATVKFLGRPGTINETNILASSPMATGQVRFIVNTYVATK